MSREVYRTAALMGVVCLAAFLAAWLSPTAWAGGTDIRVVPLPANDIVYDPFSRKIYASVPRTADGIANTITVIDPDSGSVGPSIPIGEEPTKLAISDNGQYLYVALNPPGGSTPGTVRRVDIATLTPGPEVSLGFASLPQGEVPYCVRDILVLPGQAESIAVSRGYKDGLIQYGGVAIYDAGVKRPIEAPGEGPGWRSENIMALKPSGTDSVIWGVYLELSGPYVIGSDIAKTAVDESGISMIFLLSGGGLGLFADFDLDNGMIYTNMGDLADTDVDWSPYPQWVGEFPGSFTTETLVKADSTVGLVYYLVQGDLPYTKKLQAFDQQTRRLTWSLDIPCVCQTPESLIRWGEDGLAFLTRQQQVLLVRSPLISSKTAADLDIRLAPGESQKQSGDVATLTFNVENLGPSLATGAVVTATLFSTANVVSAGATQGTCAVTNAVTCDLGDLPAGTIAEVEIAVLKGEEGLFYYTTVAATEPDPDVTNNAAGQVVTQPYFPVLPGYSWRYLVDERLTTNTVVLPKKKSINGVETLVFANRDTGGEEFYTNDSQGIQLHKEFQPDVEVPGMGKVNLSWTYTPPVRLAGGMASTGQTFQSTGIVRSNRLRRVGVTELDYSADFRIDGVDTIRVPGGEFEVLRLSGVFTVQNVPSFHTIYLARDVGVIKWGTSSCSGGTTIRELVETNAFTHDLAVTAIRAPKKVTLTGKTPSKTAQVMVQIQNRSPHPEIIQDTGALQALVTLTVESLGPCPSPVSVLRSGPFQGRLPLTLMPKKSLNVAFDMTLDCANDPAASSARDLGHYDYRYIATVAHTALGGKADSHVEDDICPRNVTSLFDVDPNPDGTIPEKGCGLKKPDGTYGADVLTDIVVK